MRTLINVVAFVLVLFGSVVPVDAQRTRVNAVQVDGIEPTDAATFVRDTAGRIYRFDAADTTAGNAINTMVDTGSFVDPSGCATTIDADGARRCSVLYVWMDTEWTTIYPSSRQCRQFASSTERYESCLKQESEAARRRSQEALRALQDATVG